MKRRIVETNQVSSTGKMERLPEPEFPEVAFAGRSNVGKSSLLNALCNRKSLFKVSNTPGRTRTIIHVEARLDDNSKLYLVDLPGYGYAKIAIGAKRAWADFMHEYLATRITLKLVVLLVDVRRGPEDEELALIEFMGQVGIPVLLVATKVDREKKSHQKTTLAKLRAATGIKVIGTSAPEKLGLDQLLETILQACDE